MTTVADGDGPRATIAPRARPLRVLFLTEWFEPLVAQKGLPFMLSLRATGCDVEVATTFPMTGPLAAYRSEVMQGIRVHRLPHFRSQDASGWRRSLTYVTFFLSALVFGLLRVRRYDVVFAYHPPITVGVAAALFGMVWRRPYVLEVADLWPDGVAHSGMAGSRTTAIVNLLCNFTYRHAASIGVASRGFRDKLLERGVPPDKLTIIYNIADEAKARPSGTLDLAPYQMDGRFNIVYGGNFGVFQRLDTVIAAAKLAHGHDPRIQLLLVGSGSDGENVRRAAAEVPDVVRIHSPVPITQVGDIFAAADLLVVNLADLPLFRIYLPSKLQFYLAMGKPILAGLEGEGAEIVEMAGAGYAVPPGNVGAMAEAMLKALALDPSERKAMGERGRDYYLATMSSAHATTAFRHLLDAAAERHRTA